MEDAGLGTDTVDEQDPTQAMSPDERGVAMLAARDALLVQPPEIPGYKIIRRIGSGGMGSVYEAEQRSTRRLVALKVIRPENRSHEKLRRFEHEALILGRLQHPGIARIYEAGTFDSIHGPQPFIAMELIRGHDLFTYVKRNHLGVRPCMDLLARICDAVQHAHEAGIIHRDLKPENILVDESGGPRILDFGIARVAETETRGLTLQTLMGILVGTVSYMSPEQAVGDPTEVDFRSDIYTIGVIGYLLLAGRLPHDFKNLPIPEAARIIREVHPPALSVFNPLCRGDVGIIIGKAMEKERARRYQSAAGMAADIRRWLRNEPIHARSPGTYYQLSRFARRNKPLVAGVVAAFIALILGLAGVSWQAAEARRARDLAAAEARRAGAEKVRSQEEARRSQKMFEFSIDMMREAGRLSDHGEPFTLLSMLDGGGRLIEERFPDEPLARAWLHYELGHLYQRVPRSDQSLHHFRLALASADKLSAPPPDLLVEIYMSLGSVGINNGADVDESVGFTRKAAGIARKHGRQIKPDVRANAETCLVTALHKSGRFEEGLDTVRRWREEVATQDFDPRWERARYLGYEARFLVALGRPGEALAPSAEAMGICRTIEYQSDQESDYWLRLPFEARNEVLSALRDNAGQEQLFEELGPQMRKGSLFVRLCFAEIVARYLDRVRPNGDEGVAAKEELLDLARQVYGESTMKTVYVYTDLIMSLWRRGRIEECRDRAVEAIEIMRLKLGPDSPELIERLNNYAAAISMRGRHDLALSLLDAYVPPIERKHGRDYPEAAKLFTLWDQVRAKAGGHQAADAGSAP